VAPWQALRGASCSGVYLRGAFRPVAGGSQAAVPSRHKLHGDRRSTYFPPEGEVLLAEVFLESLSPRRVLVLPPSRQKPKGDQKAQGRETLGLLRRASDPLRNQHGGGRF